MLASTAVASRRLEWLISELLATASDHQLPCERRGRLTEAVGFHLDHSIRRTLTRRAAFGLIGLLVDGCPQVRFWSAFSLGTIRARVAQRALLAASHDQTLVEGWWAVGDEAADALALIDGSTTGWRTADRVGAEIQHTTSG